MPFLPPSNAAAGAVTLAAPSMVVGMATPTPLPMVAGVESFADMYAEITALRRQVSAVTVEAAKVPALQGQVAALTAEAGRTFLGFGPFETTAVFVATFVAIYTLVPNPTGEQRAGDVSELRVYRQWLTAFGCLVGYALFVVAVLSHQCAAGWRGPHLGWLLALMVAPWAPVVDRVWRTLRWTCRVRRMMRARQGRNHLTAMLREYLCLGHAGVSAVGAAVELGFVTQQPCIPGVSMLLEGAEAKEFWQQWKLKTPRSGLPLSARALHDTPPLADLSLPPLSRWDPLAWSWSRRGNGDLPDASAHSGHKAMRVPSPFDQLADPTPTPWQQTLVFDALDRLLSCGTASEKRLAKLPPAVCERCRLAVRAAVEAYLESSSRHHAGVDALEWFRGVPYFYSKGTSGVLDVMWQAVFADHTGFHIDAVWACPVASGGTSPPATTSLPGHSTGSAESRGCGDPRVFVGFDRAEATQRVLLLLFVVARSLLGAAEDLSAVRERVVSHLHATPWWTVYARHFDAQQAAKQQQSIFDFNLALRATTTEEVRNILQLLLAAKATRTTAAPTACGIAGCPVAAGELLLRTDDAWRPPSPCTHGLLAGDDAPAEESLDMSVEPPSDDVAPLRSTGGPSADGGGPPTAAVACRPVAAPSVSRADRGAPRDGARALTPVRTPSLASTDGGGGGAVDAAGPAGPPAGGPIRTALQLSNWAAKVLPSARRPPATPPPPA